MTEETAGEFKARIGKINRGFRTRWYPGGCDHKWWMHKETPAILICEYCKAVRPSKM